MLLITTVLLGLKAHRRTRFDRSVRVHAAWYHERSERLRREIRSESPEASRALAHMERVLRGQTLDLAAIHAAAERSHHHLREATREDIESQSGRAFSRRLRSAVRESADARVRLTLALRRAGFIPSTSVPAQGEGVWLEEIERTAAHSRLDCEGAHPC